MKGINSSLIKCWIVIIVPLMLTLFFARDYWASTGHWWFGGSNYNMKINNIPQSDYSIYRAMNGDALIICWDHMTEYYISVSEEKVWEINRRKEISYDGDFILYFRNSLASEQVRNSRLKKIESPALQRIANRIDFTDELGQRVSISL